jgi:hypothetical protein
VFFRNPSYFTSPRIWAEEGSVYIQTYLDKGFFGTIFLPQEGYYSLFNKYIIALIMEVLGLEGVAYGTTIFSMLFMVAILMTPLLIPSKYWDTNTKKIMILLFSLFTSNGEIWLNTVAVQFYFGLFGCYLLLSDMENIHGWKKYFCIFLLFNAALTGATTVILAPFYLAKYLKEKTQPASVKNNNITVFMIIIFFGLLVQIASVTYLLKFGDVIRGEGLNRFDLNNISNFIPGVVKSFYIFYVSREFLYLRYTSILLAPVFAYVIFQSFRLASQAKYLIIMSLYMSFVFTLLSLKMYGGGRYAYASSMVIVLLLVNLFDEKEFLLNRFSAVLIVALFIFKIPQFFDTKHWYNENWVSYSASFKESKNNNNIVQIFPQWKGTNWIIKIPKK